MSLHNAKQKLWKAKEFAETKHLDGAGDGNDDDDNEMWCWRDDDDEDTMMMLRDCDGYDGEYGEICVFFVFDSYLPHHAESTTLESR